MTPRFIILNAIAVAAGGLLWVGGLLNHALAGNNGYGIAAVLLVLCVGLIAIVRGRYKAANWIAIQITKIGLCGTVLGFIIALSSIDAGLDTATRIAGMLNGMGLALYVTLSGLLANLWLRLNLFLLGDSDG